MGPRWCSLSTKCSRRIARVEWRANSCETACIPSVRPVPMLRWRAPRRKKRLMSHFDLLSRLSFRERRNVMIRWALHRMIDRFERQWKYDASYMRDLIDASPRAAWLFSRAAALGRFRRGIPLEPWFAAGITAVRSEDCGPCTQLGVSMAERAGISPVVLRALLTDDA